MGTEFDFEEVQAGGWAKLTNKWELVEGIFIETFTKPAQDQFGEQVVLVLENDGSITNIGLPGKNAKYTNTAKALKPGHRVRVTLAGFYDQDKGMLVDLPGKTKKGTSYAKSYTIQQSKEIDPNYNKVSTPSDEIDIEAIPF